MLDDCDDAWPTYHAGALRTSPVTGVHRVAPQQHSEDSGTYALIKLHINNDQTAKIIVHVFDITIICVFDECMRVGQVYMIWDTFILLSMYPSICGYYICLNLSHYILAQ